jgi:hypothetical protein
MTKSDALPLGFSELAQRKLMASIAPASFPAIGTEDWDALFQAVRSRLKMSADAPAERLNVVVQECAQALDQLHEMLTAARRQAMVTSLHPLVVERFAKPHISAESDASARRFTASCSRAEPLRL